MDNPVEDKQQKYNGFIRKCITTFNVPTTLQTDNGKEFENSIMNQFGFR